MSEKFFNWSCSQSGPQELTQQENASSQIKQRKSVTPPQNKHFNCHAMWNKLDFEGVLQNFCSEWYKTNQTKHSDLNVPGQILIEVNSVLLKKKIFPGSLRLTSIVCQHNYLFSFIVINIRNRKQFSNTNQSCYLLFSNRIWNSICSVVIAPLVSIGWCLSHGFPEQHVSYDKHRLLINNCC